MKFQTILRTLSLATGFAAALSLAGPARAQEITNTEFDDGRYVVPFAQPVSAQDTSAPASTPVMSEWQAFQAAATISAPSISERVNLMRIAVLEGWVTAVLLVVASVLGLFITIELSVLVALKRARHALRSVHSPRVSTRSA
jgi:hypothetical protein